jgi:hypothetical protein
MCDICPCAAYHEKIRRKMAVKTQGLALNGMPGGNYWTLRRNHKLEQKQ